MNPRTFHTKSLLPLSAIVALATSPALAQLNTRGCASDLQPEEVAQALLQEQAGMYQLPPGGDGVLFRIVRVKIHIVRMTNGTGGISEPAIQASFLRANAELAASRIFLIAQDEVDYIDDNNYVFGTITTAMINSLRAIRPQAKMLNIYFTDNLSNENGPLCGISSFTFSASQGIVMDNSCITGDSVLSHEIGHYFDLFHTHETALGAECVNGSNCTTAGDLLCDTPADPGLIGPGNIYRVNVLCQYTGGPTDPCANAVYTPDTHNTMSYSYTPCMNHFSAGQSGRAQATIFNGRASHLLASPDVATAIHLDTAAGAGTGTWPSPMNSFSAALAATPTGGTLAIARATANEGPITLNRKMVIYNSGTEPTTGGPAVVVRLGAP